jgi:hypothetical protein
MTRFRWSAVVLFFVTLPLSAQTTRTLTSYEAGLDLLNASPVHSLQDAQTTAPARKSPGLAALYSLLIPGMGELYAENFASGKYFLVAEGVLWLGYAAMEIHGNGLRDDARVFAVAQAGIFAEGKDDQFFVDIGNFLTIDDYNDKKLRDREPEKLYDPLAGYDWRWSSDAARMTFREERIASETMYNNQKFVGAAILINHVISAINAARAAIAYNNAQEPVLGDLHLSARVLGGMDLPHGVILTLAKEL